GENGEVPNEMVNAITPLEKERLINQLIETSRGHKDSLLLKKMEVDLVEHVARLKRAQLEKPERKVPFHLTEQQQSHIVRDYPQYDILFTHSTHSDHPMAAASRLLENFSLSDKCGDDFSDIGGCPLHHYRNSKLKKVHVCRPILDSKDAQRRIIRNAEFRKPQKHASKDVEENLYVNSLHTSCSYTISECRHTTPYMMMVQVYDVPLSTTCQSMINKGADVCYLTMITPGEILDRRECFHHDVIGCDISIDIHRDSIVYKFGSSCYTHDLSLVTEYMKTPVYVLGGYLFSIEMVEVRCGVNYYVITKSDVSPTIDCSKTLRYPRCCLELVKVKLPRFCKKTRKCLPGIDLIYVDRKFVERVYEYVVGNCSVINSKTFEWTWNFVKTSKSRVVISGKIIHRDVSINLDNLEQFVVVMLAAGVRSRMSSEYLAKNVSMFAGDASFSEIVRFTISEKIKDLKRNLNRTICDSFRKLFADALLMEFLDIDDSLEYLDAFSETVVHISLRGFGSVPSNEPEIMIADKSLNDTVDSVVSEQVRKMYVPPHVKSRDGNNRPKGGLRAGSPVGVYEKVLNILRTLSKNFFCIGSSFAFHVRAIVSKIFPFERLPNLVKVIDLLVDQVSVFKPSAFFELVSRACAIFSEKRAHASEFFYDYIVARIPVAPGSVKGFLTSCANSAMSLSELGGKFSLVFQPLVKFFDSFKHWSIFDGSYVFCFESAAIVCKRLIFDIRKVLEGRMTWKSLLSRTLFDIVFEFSLNALLSCKLGPADTIKKDLFIRSVSSVVSDGVLDGYDMSVMSYVKLSALVPMLARKFIVSFFSDECDPYVPLMRYAASDFSAYEYLALVFKNEVQGHVELIRDSVTDCLRAVGGKAAARTEAVLDLVEQRLELISRRMVKNSIDEVTKRLSDVAACKRISSSCSSISGAVIATSNRASRFVKRVMNRRCSDPGTDVYYSAASDSNDESTSAKGGLAGGNSCRSFVGVITALLALLRGLGKFAYDEVYFLIVNQLLRPLNLAEFISTLKEFKIDRLRRRNLNRIPVTFSARQFGQLVFVRATEHCHTVKSVIDRVGVAGMFKVAFLDFMDRFGSVEYLLFELPIYLAELYMYYNHPLTFSVRVVSYLISFTFQPVYTCDIITTVANGVVVNTERSVVEEIVPDEYDSDSDFSMGLGEVDYGNEREIVVGGLAGGARTNFNAISLIFRFIRFIAKLVFTSRFINGFLRYVKSSFISSVINRRENTVVSRLISSLVLIDDPASCFIPVVRAAYNRRGHRTYPVVRKVVEPLLFLENLFSKRIYDEEKSETTSVSYRRVEVETRLPSPIVRGEIITSVENLSNLRDELDVLFKNAIPTNSGNESDPVFDTPGEGATGDLRQDEVRAEECDVPTNAVAVDEIERADLTPFVAQATEEGKENERMGIDSGRIIIPKLRKGNAACCKFLNLQNISTTVPTFSISNSRSFPMCSNAIREFYYAQEMKIFSIHSKLLGYYEELRAVDFNRKAATCSQDVDLSMYDPTSNTVHCGDGTNRGLSKFSSHQFAFTSAGLKPFDLKEIQKQGTHALFHEQTHFLAANEFLKGFESHSTAVFSNEDVTIKLFEAPPGGGKTTTLIELYIERREKHKTFIVTANKNSQVEISDRVARKLADSEVPFDKRSVMTMDSYLMNRCGETCDLLFMDECFMVHAGQVLGIINKTMCKVAILFGDSKQIHYIERDEFVSTVYHDIDSFIEPFCRMYGEISYRCPWDVCEWLSKLYKRQIKSNNTSSIGKQSVSVVNIESVEDVPFVQSIKYLTYTQSEKAELRRKFEKFSSEPSVNTVHEAQGETFKNVYLVRTKFQEDAPFVSENHVIVALSRHVESLHYYVISARCYDDTASAISTMLDISEKYRTMPRSFETSSISMEVSGESPDDSRCKALSAPHDSINSFLNEILEGSNSINFGDLSAEMSSQPFDCGVDGITVREASDEKVYDDHTNRRV
nr:methyltransferase/helicase [Mint virus 1]